MRSSVLEINRRVLLRTASVALICGLAAGCSSSSTRFNGGLDSIFTASSSNQQDVAAAQARYPAGSVESAPVASVSRGSLAPAAGSASAPLPPVAESVPPVPQPNSAQIAHAGASMVGEQVSSVPVPRTLGANERNLAAPGNAIKAAAGAVASANGGYVVQPGDTISAIAQKTGVSTAALKSANGMNDGLIRVGQRLVIPEKVVQVANAPAAAAAQVAASTQQVTANTQAAVANTQAAAAKATEQVTGYTPPKSEDKVIADAEKQAAIAPDSTGIGRLRWPVRGRIISGFGGSNAGRGNDGIDISVPEGTSVKAAENGVVIYAGDGLKEFGNTVLVRHEDGLVTVYGHASKLAVSRGDKVKRGQEIALSGTSGSADVPKLHFEVRKNSAPVDPSKFLE